MTVTDAVQRRRAIKWFDPSHRLSDAEFATLMEHALLSPTAFNIQNWRFVVVRDPLLKQEIRRHGWDQAQEKSWTSTSMASPEVVLMIGGNIPGETRVASIAIYDHVEGLEYLHAHWLSGALLLLSFLLLLAVYGLNRRFRLVRP